MVGFSRSINQHSTPHKWLDINPKSQKKKSQTGAGKITKKRHSTIDVKKSKKSCKKSKKSH